MGRIVKITKVQLVLGCFLSLLLGFSATYVVSVVLLGVPLDYQVNPEYLNGLLTVTGIIFGFWIAFLTLKTPRS